MVQKIETKNYTKGTRTCISVVEEYEAENYTVPEGYSIEALTELLEADKANTELVTKRILGE